MGLFRGAEPSSDTPACRGCSIGNIGPHTHELTHQRTRERGLSDGGVQPSLSLRIGEHIATGGGSINHPRPTARGAHLSLAAHIVQLREASQVLPHRVGVQAKGLREGIDRAGTLLLKEVQQIDPTR